MDFSSIESISENDTEALYQEAIGSGIELAGVSCSHNSYYMWCTCVTKGGSMDAYYGTVYRHGYMSYGSQVFASSYHGLLSSCYWQWDSAYLMYKVHCYTAGGYTNNYTNIDGYNHNTNHSGYAVVGLGPERNCR